MSLPNNKKIVILGGGTNTYISNHLALSAPAYGNTAISLAKKFKQHSENKMDVQLILTKMASSGTDATDIRQQLKDCNNEISELTSIPNRTAAEKRLLQSRYPYKARLETYLGSFEGSNPDTPEDIEIIVDKLVADPDTRVIIFNVAMVDFKPKAVFDLFNYEDSALNMTEFGKYKARIESRAIKGKAFIQITPYQKIINKIRKERKDILLVGFKTTCGATKEEQYQKGLKLCKDASANIVFVNDVDKDRINLLNSKLSEKEKLEGILKYQHDISVNLLNLEKEVLELQNNGLVTPEESSYWYNTRDEALDALVQMVLDRSHLHFTRSTVVDSETVPWLLGEEPNRTYNPLIPSTFYRVFDYVRRYGAYKQGPTGATVGHFGIALGPNEFLTSKRKTDFNKIEEVGLVRVITDDPDNVFGYKHFFEDKDFKEKSNEFYRLRDSLKYAEDDEHIFKIEQRIRELQTQYNFFEKRSQDKVIAFGAKPSVGGQSQRSLFEAFPDLDCIVHFHCPLKTESRELFKPVKQFGVECGSHECGQNTAMNMKEFKLSSGRSVWAVHLDHHGPNIIFDSNTADPQEIIEFIATHWSLDKRTTGLNDELI